MADVIGLTTIDADADADDDAVADADALVPLSASRRLGLQYTEVCEWAGLRVGAMPLPQTQSRALLR